VVVLLWGDARIGNMIFAPGGTPVAVLDWETATFGQAEEDLAWYLLAAPFNIRQLTDVLRCKLQQHFRRKRHRSGR
jgi:aminoglycoside phosphotransferase (APT) family kinase protein